MRRLIRRKEGRRNPEETNGGLGFLVVQYQFSPHNCDCGGLALNTASMGFNHTFSRPSL